MPRAENSENNFVSDQQQIRDFEKQGTMCVRTQKEGRKIEQGCEHEDIKRRIFALKI